MLGKLDTQSKYFMFMNRGYADPSEDHELAQAYEKVAKIDEQIEAIRQRMITSVLEVLQNDLVAAEETLRQAIESGDDKQILSASQSYL